MVGKTRGLLDQGRGIGNNKGNNGKWEWEKQG